MIFRKKAREATAVTTSSAKKGKRTLVLAIDKRQKFVLGMIVLSIILFLSEFQFGKSSGVVVAVVLALLTNVILYWSIKDDLKDKFSISVFILPFFYTLSFALFYFLIPTRLLFRLILTGLYSFGLYSLFLSENIFTVSSIRTIALLSGARIVSFVVTLVSYFFLTNITFSLHQPIFITLPIVALYTYPLVYQSLWTYNLQGDSLPMKLWAGVVSLCILEVALAVWLWPSSPTIIALFLSGFLYTLVGLSHVWVEKRLFRNVMWEYVWVGAIVLFLLLLFTSWGD